jgi:uncharacterized membrane protein YqhA
MFEHLLKVRYVVVVIVLFNVLNAVTFIVLGAQSAVVAYGHVLKGHPAEGANRPGLELLHSLDLFFVAIVLMVLALGFAKLFLLHPTPEQNAALPAWLRFESIRELKVLLWETILTALLILGLSQLTATLFVKPDWDVLILPAAILVLALSLYFMKKE